VSGGEHRADGALLAGAHALQALLEFGHRLAGAQHDSHIGEIAAFETGLPPMRAW